MFDISHVRHLSAAALLLGLATHLHAAEPVKFRVSIDSVAKGNTLLLPDGSRAKAPISPGLYLVSRDGHALFEPGRKASANPLERLAEDGNAAPLIEALNKAAGADVAKPFMHNDAFTVTAKPGDRLHFALMFVQSNDLFYAPRDGIALFDAKQRPISGDLTGEIVLWDAGTEINEAPGAGPNQAPRQASPNSGPDENGVVHRVNDGFEYPASGQVVRVTIRPLAKQLASRARPGN